MGWWKGYTKAVCIVFCNYHQFTCTCLHFISINNKPRAAERGKEPSIEKISGDERLYSKQILEYPGLPRARYLKNKRPQEQKIRHHEMFGK